MDDLIAEFVSETREMLQALERELVAWERDPSERERLDAIFRFVHTVKGNCGFFDLPRLEALAHAAEDALSEVRNGTRQADTTLVDAVLAVIDRIAEMIETVSAGGDISVGSDADLIAALSDEAVPARIEDAGPGAPEPQPAPSASRVQEIARSVRLPTELIDRVMSGVSDMILVRNELDRKIRDSESETGLQNPFNRLSTILGDMQSAMSRVRMQPIGNLFVSYQRMVRDLAAELGKQVEVEVESGQVEIDREMVELLRDPLLHMIRNAIDHGIEGPDERSECGKPATGRLLLSARQTGNQIRIGIIDDGRGIDGDKLVEKAIERGLITADQAARLEPHQRNLLICEPGLSTAREVTQLSGRGVGMDVVRAAIERIGGQLQIDSTPGAGCSFQLDVPLTLSIVPSITVAAGDQTFALPRSYVVEIARNAQDIEAERIGGVRHVRIRAELHPCVALSEILGIESEVAPIQQTLVMVKLVDGTIFALGVDGIAEHGELVIRPVAPQIIATGLYAGVAQLNDGRPALMIDVAGIARLAGLIVDGQGRARFEQVASEKSETAALLQVIVFTAGDGLEKAVEMSAVERLAEVSVEAIGWGGGVPHIVVDGAIVPLLGYSAPTEADTIDVLLLSGHDRRLAVVTAGTVEAAEVDPATMTGEGSRRLILLEGRPVELVDPEGLEAAPVLTPARPALPTCRLPADDSWSQEFLKPMVQAAGYEVVDDRAQLVDLEVLFEGTSAADVAANDVLVIGTGAKSKRQGKAAVHRDDHEALAKALRASGKRRKA